MQDVPNIGAGNIKTEGAAAGSLLVSDGAGSGAFVTNDIGLVLVKTQVVGTGVSSVTVTNAFSADYANYRLTWTGGVGSTAASINMRLGASTASYYSASIGSPYATDAVSYLRDNNASSWQWAGGMFPEGATVDVTLYQPFQAARTGFYINGRQDYRTNGGAFTGNGFHNVASSFSDFVFFPNAGTMTGGTIRVYGYRN
jgi:hypothetical protein